MQSLDRARPMFKESLAIYERIGDRSGITKLREALAFSMYLQGDHDAALALQEENLRTFRDLREPFRIGNALTLIALFRVHAGRFDEAREALAEAMATWRAAGDLPTTIQTLLVAAHALVREGRAEAAAEVGGAIAALRESMGELASALDILNIADPMVAARQALGDEAFEAAIERGRTLDLDAVVTLAMSSPTGAGADAEG